VQGELVFIKDNLRDTDEAAFDFAVGDHVFASRRKVLPLNEEGGVVRVQCRVVISPGVLPVGVVVSVFKLSLFEPKIARFKFRSTVITRHMNMSLGRSILSSAIFRVRP
jgi:hypothetical protein